MSMDKDRHLNEDQLLLSVVEEAELPMPLQEHLAACSRCRINKEELDENEPDGGKFSHANEDKEVQYLNEGLRKERQIGPGHSRDGTAGAQGACGRGRINQGVPKAAENSAPHIETKVFCVPKFVVDVIAK